MPRPTRAKIERQEDRLDRELDEAKAKPHPETAGPLADEITVDAEDRQEADIEPSEVNERSIQKDSTKPDKDQA